MPVGTLGPAPVTGDGPFEPIPAQMAAVIRPELPSLCDEIRTGIRAGIEEYALVPVDRLDAVLRHAVEQNVQAFVDRIARRPAAAERVADLCRQLGRIEALEGRTLDSLQAAYRIGVRLAWRRTMDVGARYRLPAALMAHIADSMFAYVDEMCESSRAGFLAAHAEANRDLDAARRELARAILGRAGRAEIARLAEDASWDVPDRVSAIVLPPGGRCEPDRIGSGAVSDPTLAHPTLVVPADDDRQTLLARLSVAVAGGPAVIGPAVPIDRAPDSARWAERLLELQRRGLLPGGVLDADDHLLTLWMHADTGIAELLARRQLAPLDALDERWRERLIETLHLQLTVRGGATEIAHRLGVHPQTVRYRMRVLRSALGPDLLDPDWRFATELALRTRFPVPFAVSDNCAPSA